MRPHLGLAVTLLLLIVIGSLAPVGREPVLAAQAKRASYNDVSFTYDSSLSSGVTGETIPVPAGKDVSFWEKLPEHTVFHFPDYPPVATFEASEPLIYVIPVSKYEQMLTDATQSISDLQASLDNQANPDPIDGRRLVLPLTNAGMEFISQYHHLDFGSGRGERFITALGQDVGATELKYTTLVYYYQGLTSDGQFLVAGVFPLFVSIAQPPVPTFDYNNSDASLQAVFSYYRQVASELSKTDDASYTPHLDVLDSMMKSLVVGGAEQADNALAVATDPYSGLLLTADGRSSCCDASFSQNPPKVGEQVTAHAVVVNVSNQPLTIRSLVVAVRGPGASTTGWSAPQADFDAIHDLVLQPGDQYEYSKTRSFSEPGDYFAELMYQNTDGKWIKVAESQAPAGGSYTDFSVVSAPRSPTPIPPTNTATQTPSATPTATSPPPSNGLVVVSHGGSPLTLIGMPQPGECTAGCFFDSGQQVTARVTFKNNSGQSIHIKALTVGGRGPDAPQKNWNAPNRDWATITDFDLAPGEEYTYEQPRTFTELGDYFAEPAYQDANGHWGGVQVDGSAPAQYARVTFKIYSPDVTPPPPGGPATPTPVAGFRLKINGLSWDPAPSAFNPTNLTIHMAPIVGLKQGGYMVRLQVYADYRHDPLELWYNSDVPRSASHLSAAFLPQHKSFDLQVKDLRLPQTIVGSGIDVTVITNQDSQNIYGQLTEQPLSVAESSESWRHCVAVLPGAIGEIVSEVAPVPKSALPTKVAMDLLVGLSVDNLDVMNTQAQCGDNEECQARALEELRSRYRDTLTEAGFSGVAEKLLGDAALPLKLVKAAYDLFPDTAKCLSWITDVESEDVLLIDQAGKDVNMASTGSPVYPLVTSSNGQRAGFLSDGKTIEEIPGSHAVEIGEHRFVVFPSLGQFSVQISGYADGVMNVRTVFSHGQVGIRTADYSSVPVTKGMSAHLDSGDSAGVLQVDATAGGGHSDKTIAPRSSRLVSVGASGGEQAFGLSYMALWGLLVGAVLLLATMAFIWDARFRRR